MPAAVQGKAQQEQAWSRSMSSQVTLSDLRDNPGARKKKVRVGRGTGSGKGKMGGRGHKGQLSRAGNNGRLGFEGGQTPITRRYPKRGFNNAHSYLSDLQPLNLDRLVRYVDAGRLDLTKTITMKHLRDCGCVSSKIKKGVKLLARNAERVKIEKAINIQVSDVSSKAKELIEKAGGSVQVSYFNALGLRALLKPEKFDTIPRLVRRACAAAQISFRMSFRSSVESVLKCRSLGACCGASGHLCTERGRDDDGRMSMHMVYIVRVCCHA